jgi:hypothetical protein
MQRVMPYTLLASAYLTWSEPQMGWPLLRSNPSIGRTQ